MMIVIGSAKKHLMSSNSQEAEGNIDKPVVTPRDMEEIIPAAGIDGNPSSNKVNSEYYFNSETPYAPTNSDIERSVEQVLIHTFGPDESNINKALDHKPKAAAFLRERVEAANTSILLIEKGLRDRQTMDIAQSMDEKRQAVSNIIKQNESGNSREIFDR